MLLDQADNGAQLRCGFDAVSPTEAKVRSNLKSSPERHLANWLSEIMFHGESYSKSPQLRKYLTKVHHLG